MNVGSLPSATRDWAEIAPGAAAVGAAAPA
jgi:hypothetical protein